MRAFNFRHHVIDDDLPPGRYGQTVLADLNGEGRLDFVMGQQFGTLFRYEYEAPDRWRRSILGEDSPSDVGAIALDVDGNGLRDIVTGGVWYRNAGVDGAAFERIVFDPELSAVHDIVAADIDGDGRPEVITMSDQHTLRWYRIPDDPRRPWPRHDIGPAVHAGLSVGDLDGDGNLDLVRTNVWFQNVDGDASRWVQRPIGPSSPPPEDFLMLYALDATRSRVCDVDGDGHLDVVFTDCEIPGPKVWWMENVDGNGLTWKRHDIPHGDNRRRGPYHSLYVGDLDGDGDLDVFSCEMESIRRDGTPAYYIWENLDGVGGAWREHKILDVNLGGHETVVGDVTGNGLPDLLSKPWEPHADNALGGRMFVLFLENVSGAEGD